MKKCRFFALFLLLSLLLSLSAAAIEPANIEAKAALLVEAETGEILCNQNIHQKLYPASITKVTVALLVLEAIDSGKLSIDQKITANASAFEGLSPYGSTAGIKAGDILTVEELLKCMLIVSANEACNILAEAICGQGNILQFVALMNERAERLGCENTHYVNTSGLHDPMHYSSAWDIYLITQEALKHDEFLKICNSKSAEITSEHYSGTRVLHSTNYLISNWRATGYLYRDAQGVKTGSTDEAGHCLVSTAVRGNRRLISVVLGAETVTDESGKGTLVKSFSETSRLFEWGFTGFESKSILKSSEAICELPVRLSSETNYVVLHPAESLMRMMPVDVSPADLERTVTLNSEAVDAPVAAGDVLGEMTLSYNGTTYATVPLLALSDVSASRLLIFKHNLVLFFSRTAVRITLAVVLLVFIAAFIFSLSHNSPRRRYGKRSRYGFSGSYRGKR